MGAITTHGTVQTYRNVRSRFSRSFVFVFSRSPTHMHTNTRSLTRSHTCADHKQNLEGKGRVIQDDK